MSAFTGSNGGKVRKPTVGLGDRCLHCVRFQVLTAASMKFRIVFWDVLPCKIIVDRRFRGTCCLPHQRWLFYTAVHPRRQFWTVSALFAGRLCTSSGEDWNYHVSMVTNWRTLQRKKFLSLRLQPKGNTRFVAAFTCRHNGNTCQQQFRLSPLTIDCSSSAHVMKRTCHWAAKRFCDSRRVSPYPRHVTNTHFAWHVTERRNWLATCPASYLGGPGFKSRPGDRQSWLRVWFSSALPGDCWDSTLKLGNDRFLSHPF
jgi:hypothetical protein